MALETSKWDVAEHLTTPESIAAYLEAVLEDGDPVLISAALGDISRAKGLSGTAQSDLSDALNGDPRLTTFLDVLKNLGLELSVHPTKRIAAE